MKINIGSGQPTIVRVAAHVLFVLSLVGVGSQVGCGRSGGVVDQTSEYSYEDVAKQLAAEETAAKLSGEKSQ